MRAGDRAAGMAALPRDLRLWLLGACGALAGVPLSLWLWLLLSDEPLAGIRVGGVPVPQGVHLSAFLEREAELWAGERLLIETGFHEWRPTRGTLGAGLPVAPARRAVQAVGHTENPVVAFGALWDSWQGVAAEIEWRAVIMDEPALDRYVAQIRTQVDRVPVPGTVDGHGRPVRGIPGETLDVDLTKRAIRLAVRSGQTHVRVPTRVTPPPTALRRPTPGVVDESILMMRQETTYRATGRGRAVNIELSAKKLDGRVIAPNAVLSFNAVVGKRTRARGFQPATELRNGEVVDGVGGGICQTAGTLHAAAFFAGMAVEEYQPHSRLNRFAYLRPGLDAMVAWPDHVTDLEATRDLKIRNTYPFPVVVRTTLVPAAPKKRAIVRVDLRGAARAFRVDWSFREVGRVPSRVRRRYDRRLPPGETKLAQRGMDGIVISRRRTIYTPDGREEDEQRVAYPPMPKVVLEGPTRIRGDLSLRDLAR